jgi:hypothetical protein
LRGASCTTRTCSPVRAARARRRPRASSPRPSTASRARRRSRATPASSARPSRRVRAST